MDHPAHIWVLTLATYICSLYPSDPNDIDLPPRETLELNLEYDYVIVGGGSAGSVLASRLTEDPRVSVVLLEAGGQETQVSEIPGLAPYLQLSSMDWQYKTEPSSTSCLAMIDNRCNFPRGKVIGGSSSINYMLYVRGNQHDYDSWEAMGNPGWGFSDVLPYFKLSEDNTNPSIAKDKEYHRSGGYLTIGDPPWRTPLASAFVEAGAELGYPVRDFNGNQQTGFMVPEGFIRKGSRCSNARAFLRPLQNRPNLHIALHAFVTKVLIHSEMRRAYGVVFDRNDRRGLEVYAHREVILSAGSINSPQLLMLSGIGPAEHLAQHNISLIADLPVGKNLQDHVAAGPIFTIDQPVSLQTSRLNNLPAMLRYVSGSSGPLATFGGVEGIGFISTKYANESMDWPDIEYHFLSGSHGSDNGEFFYKILGLKKLYWNEYYDYLHNIDHFSIITKLMRPHSRGYIRLNSSDPYSYPKIVANYFDIKKDTLVLIEGIKKAIELGNTFAFQKFGAKLFDLPMPGCEGFVFGSDSYWDCFARHLTLTIFHYCGTAKMGPYWDPESVVDPQLRVYGIGGLRVVDASIFPTITTGNTNAPVTMVAEKAAHMILEYYQNHISDPVPLIPIKLPSATRSHPQSSSSENNVQSQLHDL